MLQDLQTLHSDSAAQFACWGIHICYLVAVTACSSMSLANHEGLACADVLIWVNYVHRIDVYVLAQLGLE